MYTMDMPITTRLPEEFLARIKELAKRENLDTSSVIRRLLARALEEEKFKITLEKLSLHKISIEQAAKILNTSIWEIIEVAKENNVDWIEYGGEELEHDLKAIGKSKKFPNENF
jgi:predicted HTH domain antitoxin